jgi:hypothetical protein
MEWVGLSSQHDFKSTAHGHIGVPGLVLTAHFVDGLIERTNVRLLVEETQTLL